MKRQILLTIGVITTVFTLSLGITISGVKYLELERDYQRLEDSLVSGLFFNPKVSASATETVTPLFIQSVVKAYNHRITESQSLQIAYSLDSWIVARNLSLRTSLAIVAHESRFDPGALGGVGDKGLWQLNEMAIKELERRYDVTIDRSRLFEIDYNCRWGTLYFRLCAILANGNRKEAIARYHYTTEWWKADCYVEKVMVDREKIENTLFVIDK